MRVRILFSLCFAFAAGCVGRPTDMTAADGGMSEDGGSHVVHLQWDASTTPNVTYTVYRAIVSGGPYAPLASAVTALTFADASVTPDTTYFYVVSASDGVSESVASNEASTRVP